MSSARKPAARKRTRTQPKAKPRAKARAKAKVPRGTPARLPASPAVGSAPARRATPRPSGAAAGTVTVGQRLADFSLPATGQRRWRLTEARGAKLVLYFYPRDNTPGCTLEGRDFAALAARFAQVGASIAGISRDSIAAHEKFRDQMAFPFPLLSDQDERVCRLFDVIRAKNMYGRQVVGIERSTFLLDGEGILRRVWRKVRVQGHALEVLDAAAAL